MRPAYSWASRDNFQYVILAFVRFFLAILDCERRIYLILKKNTAFSSKAVFKIY